MRHFCPSCGKQIESSEEQVKQTVACPSCSYATVVPKLATPVNTQSNGKIYRLDQSSRVLDLECPTCGKVDRVSSEDTQEWDTLWNEEIPGMAWDCPFCSIEFRIPAGPQFMDGTGSLRGELANEKLTIQCECPRCFKVWKIDRRMAGENWDCQGFSDGCGEKFRIPCELPQTVDFVKSESLRPPAYVPRIGDKAPNISVGRYELNSGSCGQVQLNPNSRNGNTVLLFVPPNFTHTVYSALVSYSKQFKYSPANVICVGINSAKAQAEQAQIWGISIAWYSDSSEKAIKAYGLACGGMSGDEIDRFGLFVIDGVGIVRHSEVTKSINDLPNWLAALNVVAGFKEHLVKPGIVGALQKKTDRRGVQGRKKRRSFFTYILEEHFGAVEEAAFYLAAKSAVPIIILILYFVFR